jgi:hypothetical protein
MKKENSKGEHTGIRLQEGEKAELKKMADALGQSESGLFRLLLTALNNEYKIKGGISLPICFRSRTDIQLEENLACIRMVKTTEELRDILLTVVVPGYSVTTINECSFSEADLKVAVEKRLEILRRK